RPRITRLRGVAQHAFVKNIHGSTTGLRGQAIDSRKSMAHVRSSLQRHRTCAIDHKCLSYILGFHCQFKSIRAFSPRAGAGTRRRTPKVYLSGVSGTRKTLLSDRRAWRPNDALHMPDLLPRMAARRIAAG